jgi:Spy/CpxP family protein refolding chaperone
MKKTGVKIAIFVVLVAATLSVFVLGTQLLAAGRPFDSGQRRGPMFGPMMFNRPNMWPQFGPMRPYGFDVPRRAEKKGVAPNLMQLLRRLDLTNEQAEQIKEILKTNKEKAQAAQKTIVEARKALNEAVLKGANEAAIRDAATALGKTLGDAAVLRANVKASIEKILTNEQRTKLEELRKTMKEKSAKLLNKMQNPNRRRRVRPGYGSALRRDEQFAPGEGLWRNW